MSLLEALLQDPVPMGFFIAIRDDGLIGSGTETDAWNGNAFSPRISVVSITRTGSVATVTTSVLHGFQIGETVFVEGVTGIGSGVNKYTFYNGAFLISSVTPTTFNYTMAADPGGTATGTITCRSYIYPVIAITSLTRIGTVASVTTSVPHGLAINDLVLIEGVTGISGAGTNQYYYYNGVFVITGVSGSPAKAFTYTMAGDPGGNATGNYRCRRNPYLFDEAMRRIPASPPTTVHLGPGLFETKGNRTTLFDPADWQPRSGIKICGSGMAETTLRMVRTTVPGQVYTAIGVPSGVDLDSVEVSDLSVDCNGAESSATAQEAVTRAAVWIRGSHTRIRRVRAINFSRQTLAYECFVIAVAGPRDGGPEVSDAVIEECIVEAPSRNNVKETTCLMLIGGETGYGAQLYFRSCVIRDCFVDCDYQENALNVESIKISAGVATVKTRVPHNLTVDKWVRISGARVPTMAVSDDDEFDNGYNGAYRVVDPSPGGDPTKFTYVPSIDPAVDAQGEIWLGKWPSHYVAITGITVSGSNNTWTIRVTTSTPHFLNDGTSASDPANTVVLWNVKTAAGADSSINGVQKVSSILSNKQFQYQHTGSDPTTTFNLSAALIGVTFQGTSIDGGSDSVLEGNRLWNCRYGGPYQDTFSSKDCTIRNNHYKGVFCGPFTTWRRQLGSPLVATSLTPTGSLPSDIGLFTMANPHGLSVGQGIQVFARSGTPPSTAPYTVDSGVVLSIADPDGKTFTYKLTASTSDPAHASPPPFVTPLWEKRDFTCENNLIEIVPSLNLAAQAWGIGLFGVLPVRFEVGKAFLFRNVLVRNNIIRYVDSVPQFKNGNATLDRAIAIFLAEFARIEENVIDLRLADGSLIVNPLIHVDSKSVGYFNNTTPGGKLVQGALATGYDVITVIGPQQELTTQVDEAFALALL